MTLKDPPYLPLTLAGPVSAGTSVWRLGGKLHLTVAVKVTFALVPGGAMTVLPPEDMFRGELHHRDNPTRSIRATSDVVPYLPRVDVVFTGHAYAPQGRPVTMLTVKLGLHHGRPLFEKSLYVYGDRKGQELVPFETMPIVYEKALGGIGFAQNPFGTGVKPGSTPPNLIHPADAGAVAGFGPLSRALIQRKTLLGKVPGNALDQAIPELPAEIDWSYFQAAPPDQRVDALVGNEWVLLEGLSPGHPRLMSRLPTVRGVASVYGMAPGAPDEAQVLALRPDMLRLDGDAGRCSVVLRGVVPLEDEQALDTIRIVAGVETEALKLAWPEAPPARREPGRAAGAPAMALGEDEPSTSDEVTLRREDAPAPPRAMPHLPGGGAGAGAVAISRVPENPFEGTVSLEGEDAALPPKQAVMPFGLGARPSAPASGASSGASSGAAPLPLPGAPWSQGSASQAPALVPMPGGAENTRAVQFGLGIAVTDLDLDTQEAPPPPSEKFSPPPPSPAPPTVVITEPPASSRSPKQAIPPTPAIPPRPVIPPKPAEKVAAAPAPEAAGTPPSKPTWSWATPAPEPRAAEPPPPKSAPKAPVKPPVSKSLYGFFSPKKK